MYRQRDLYQAKSICQSDYLYLCLCTEYTYVYISRVKYVCRERTIFISFSTFLFICLLVLNPYVRLLVGRSVCQSFHQNVGWEVPLPAVTSRSTCVNNPSSTLWISINRQKYLILYTSKLFVSHNIWMNFIQSKYVQIMHTHIFGVFF